MMPRVGAAILAAGTASRMGRQKLLLPLGEQPVLGHVFTTVRQIPFAETVAVIGEPRQELTALGSQYGIRTVYNSERLSGQASSIATAITHLPGDLDGILFLPGDQPLISVDLLQALLMRFSQEADNQQIVVPSYQKQYRSPVLFGSAWLPELLLLSGDRGGRAIIGSNPQAAAVVEWQDEAPFWDTDTWEDYLRLVRYLHKK